MENKQGNISFITKKWRQHPFEICVFVIAVMLILTQCTQTPDAESSQPTSTPDNTSEPIVTRTKEEQVAQDIIETGGQMASSATDCVQILETEDWCGVIKGAVQVTRPEWEALFPQAEFYIVQRDVYGGEFVQQRNLLIVEQNGQRLSTFPDELFEQLLEINDIVVTDDNRESVAQAFILLRLSNYLEANVEFSTLQKGEWPAPFDSSYNYSLTTEAEIQELKIHWFFWFYEGELITVRGNVALSSEMDYPPSDNLLPPSQESLTYWNTP